MYVDPKTLERQKNFERLREIGILVVLVVFIAFEYQALHDVLVRATHRLVLTETNKISYAPSMLGWGTSPEVSYRWKGVDYTKAVGGLWIANSSSIIPPVKLLVDPENPTTSVLKTPYGGWSAWWIDFALLQAALGAFVYAVFIGPWRRRANSYFQ